MHITNAKFFYRLIGISVVLAVSLLFDSGVADAAVDKHTVAVWLFEEGTGKIVKDASGNGHDGNFKGSPKWVKAKFGTGLEFPGDAGGYVVVDSTKKLELETLTIELWVKVEESTGKWQGMVCKQQAGCTNRNYGIWVHVDKSVFHAQNRCKWRMRIQYRWHNRHYRQQMASSRLYLRWQDGTPLR